MRQCLPHLVIFRLLIRLLDILLLATSAFGEIDDLLARSFAVLLAVLLDLVVACYLDSYFDRNEWQHGVDLESVCVTRSMEEGLLSSRRGMAGFMYKMNCEAFWLSDTVC